MSNPNLSEAQQALVELIESSIEDKIDAIGDPSEQEGKIVVPFRYGKEVYTAHVDPEAGTMTY